MSEQDSKADDADSASEIMEATYGPKAKRLRLARTEMQLQQLQLHLDMKQRELKQEREKEDMQDEQRAVGVTGLLSNDFERFWVL